MEHLENSTASSKRVFLQSSAESQADKGDGNAYLYILIVMSFYVVFLCGIMLGYFRSKRREKRRVNIFTRLLHEEEQREWGALPKKSNLGLPAAVSGLRSAQVTLPFCGNHGNHFGHIRYDGSLPSPLACALCIEQSSISSLCSSADTRFTIEEEELDSGAAEGAEGRAKGGSESSGDNSG
ncbi:potassium voltage-gated channel subfamily E member 4 [Xenentodon cancila]